MHSAIRIISLMSILSLILGSLTGCGEKRIHVATVSGTPGEETAVLSPRDESATTETSGLSEDSIDESSLSVQDSAADEIFREAETSAMTNEPVNMAHVPSLRSSQDGSLDSFMADSLTSTQESGSSLADSMLPAPASGVSGNDDSLTSTQESGSSLADSMLPAQASGVPENNDSFAPFGEGRDFAAQSSSSPEEHTNHSLANIEDFKESPKNQYSDPIPSALSQDASDALENAFSGKDVEPVLDSFQIAKVEPSDSQQDQLSRIKNQALAASAKGLEDVFFQFDSWRLTQEGKQSLQRTFGWFEQNPSSIIIIEGHADQRGTEAYNMVLAKKRAVAVQDYLSQLGVDPSRLAVISYGKDKPFCLDTTEVCYQLNRRGHLLVPNP